VRGQGSRPKLRPADQSKSAALTIASGVATGPPPPSALATEQAYLDPLLGEQQVRGQAPVDTCIRARAAM
jgi:hypothetical protein